MSSCTLDAFLIFVLRELKNKKSLMDIAPCARGQGRFKLPEGRVGRVRVPLRHVVHAGEAALQLCPCVHLWFCCCHNA